MEEDRDVEVEGVDSMSVGNRSRRVANVSQTFVKTMTINNHGTNVKV